jgi:transposase InsO family protein
MKKKDNSNVQESFQKSLLDSDIQEYSPTILMSDNDSTFIDNSFQQILE